MPAPALGLSLQALARLESLDIRGMKLGLAAIGAVCQRLGDPERAASSVLIAGTNGKGSTAATLSAIARSGGVRAGLYTSPHLCAVTERIRVEEEDISPEELDGVLERVFRAADAAPAVPVTYFEALTAAAFLHFRERRVDLAVLEVGLGGRLDATNLAPAAVSVVTSISLDHTEELGPTLASVAREKAGVFRRGRPALARAREPEALDALRSCAGAEGAAFHDAAAEIRVTVRETGLDGTRFEAATPEHRLDLATPLPGEHQAWNAALAVRAAELLRDKAFSFAPAAFEAGVRSVRWPGRIETIEARGATVLLDGCHNAEGAAALAEFLDRAGLAGRCSLVFGAMADKDIEEMTRLLLPAVAGVTFVTGPSPRAATAAELVRRAAPGRREAREATDVTTALAERIAQDGGDPIIVAGSLYLVGQARAWLLERC